MVYSVLSHLGRILCVFVPNFPAISLFLLHPVNYKAYFESFYLDPVFLWGMF